MQITDLIGKTITDAQSFPPETFGYDEHGPNCIVITLNEEVSLGILSDYEGNSPGIVTWTEGGEGGYIA